MTEEIYIARFKLKQQPVQQLFHSRRNMYEFHKITKQQDPKSIQRRLSK